MKNRVTFFAAVLLAVSAAARAADVNFDNPKANGETAGALYRVRGVTKGRPEFVSRL